MRTSASGSYWWTAAKIAWRELRASPAKFLFVVFAVAAGVAALTGVRGFSEAFRTMLSSKARTLMAADLSARDFAVPTPEQERELARLVQRGARVTRITETLTMMNSAANPTPLMVSVKAVDPAAYPFYGRVKLRPAGDLASVLNDNTIAVADDVLARLGTSIGDEVRLGGQNFRIAAVVDSEPDRMTGSLNVGLRVMATQGGLARTGLIRFGSRASERTLMKLPASGLTAAEAKADLKRIFPEAQVIDYRETNPSITRGLDRATMFLSLISLIALIVGALGVASAIHAHLQQKMDTIAVLKSIGARSGEVIRIYTIEALLLGLGGALLGIAAGEAIERVFPALLSRYFQLTIEFHWHWAAMAQGLAAGLLTTYLFTLPPLLRIRRIRPNLILRREMTEARGSWRKRLREGRQAFLAGLAILAGLGALAGWLGGSARAGVYFAGGLAVSLAVLSAVAWAMLRGLKALLRKWGAAMPSSLRQGLANLYRPGNQAQAVLVALGIGVMFTLSVYLVQRSLIGEIIATAPPGMPNVFLIDVQPAQRDGVLSVVRGIAGAGAKIDIVPSIQGRLVRVNGVPVDSMNLKGWARRFTRTRAMTTSDGKPDGVTVVSGAWWPKSDSSPRIAVAEEAARTLKIGPGSRLDFTALDRNFQVTVAAVYRTDGFRMGSISEFTLTPQILSGLPAIYYGAVHLRPAQVAPLQRQMYGKYPTVTVINVAEALALIQEVVDQIALVIRFLSAFTIAGGIIILASSVAGTRFRRVREVVILKTLGGTRSRIARIFSVEFLVLGTVAGLMGGLLAAGFSTLILRRLLEGEGHIQWTPVPAAVALTALAAVATGWLASFRILGQRPLQVLREE